MPKRHLAVVLLLPPPWATEVDGLRRACRDPRRERIVPHITLAAPTNVAEEDLPGVLASLRVAAGRARAVELVVGPLATFAPVTPLAYLSVGGEPAELAVLEQLRRDLAVGPFDRPLARRFVPHVTVSGEEPRARLDAMLQALDGWRVELEIGVVSLMELTRRRPASWLPLAEEVLGLPRPAEDVS